MFLSIKYRDFLQDICCDGLFNWLKRSGQGVVGDLFGLTQIHACLEDKDGVGHHRIGLTMSIGIKVTLKTKSWNRQEPPKSAAAFGCCGPITKDRTQLQGFSGGKGIGGQRPKLPLLRKGGPQSSSNATHPEDVFKSRYALCCIRVHTWGSAQVTTSYIASLWIFRKWSVRSLPCSLWQLSLRAAFWVGVWKTGWDRPTWNKTVTWVMN